MSRFYLYPIRCPIDGLVQRMNSVAKQVFSVSQRLVVACAVYFLLCGEGLESAGYCRDVGLACRESCGVVLAEHAVSADETGLTCGVIKQLCAGCQHSGQAYTALPIPLLTHHKQANSTL